MDQPKQKRIYNPEVRIGTTLGEWKLVSCAPGRRTKYIAICSCGKKRTTTFSHLKRIPCCRLCLGKKRLDKLTGEKKGKLTIVGNETYKGFRRLKVRCACSKEYHITPHQWNSKECPKPCKSCTRGRPVGSILGGVVILKRLGKARYHVRCVKCGKEREWSARKYKGQYVGCPCYTRESRIAEAEKKIGLKYSSLTVHKIAPSESGRIYFIMKCKCGKRFKRVNGHEFKSTSCGCAISIRACRGENKGNARLKNFEVESIRELHKSGGYNPADLADMFDVSPHYINRIIKRQIWKSVS